LVLREACARVSLQTLWFPWEDLLAGPSEAQLLELLVVQSLEMEVWVPQVLVHHLWELELLVPLGPCQAWEPLAPRKPRHFSTALGGLTSGGMGALSHSVPTTSKSPCQGDTYTTMQSTYNPISAPEK